jgi:hypothetical protein
LERFTEPKEVSPVVGIRVVGKTILAPVGGEVVIDVALALDEEHAKSDTDGKVTEQQVKVGLSLSENVWWWDVR